ncbi:MAG: hypothetical protein D6B28_06805 [Gammaproteobacteria bacterium]|nr:MAG: hypothetical protein D6B28_06805 [Gammaproteobacteria bacterium]
MAQMFTTNVVFKDFQDELERNTESYTWRPLRILNIYRVLVVLSLTSFFFILALNGSYDVDNFSLFFGAAYTYCFLSVMFGFMVLKRRPRFRIQLFAQLFADVLFLSLLIFAKGKVDSTLGVLLVISVAGSSILLSRRMAVAGAALAALSILSAQTYMMLYADADISAYSSAGALGIVVFIAALSANAVARHAKEFEILAQKRGKDIVSLEQLNDYIVQKLQSGVLALNSDMTIRLINTTAEKMVGDKVVISGMSITDALPVIAAELDIWLATGKEYNPVVKLDGGSAQISFEKINGGIVLVFLDDHEKLSRQIQEEKLASLGKLTASIAHEIRNPLGAISHAGQLLAESPELPDQDKRLTEIIHDHSERLNTIIKSILHLSRKRDTIKTRVELDEWLDKFAYDFSIEKYIDVKQILISQQDMSMYVETEVSAFEQVMWNLCSNALNYSTAKDGEALVKIMVYEIDDCITIDVVNIGEKIEEKYLDRIFEPFFTTSASGTGLGLYLCKELCNNNNIELRYVRDHQDGTCFRLVFPHKEQNIETDDN